MAKAARVNFEGLDLPVHRLLRAVYDWDLYSYPRALREAHQEALRGPAPPATFGDEFEDPQRARPYEPDPALIESESRLEVSFSG